MKTIIENGINRYSDEALEEFKKILLEKKKKALQEIESAKGVFQNSDSFGNTDEEVVLKASITYGIEGISTRQVDFLKNINNALQRIENKTYGICCETGKIIPEKRLKAVPTTTRSIEVKKNTNLKKSQNGN